MDYLPELKCLIKTVVRRFYEPYHIVLVDIILENILIYDHELQKLMKMHNKEINKLLVVLKEDKIVKYENKVEILEDKRQYLRTVYYINFVEVRDIIKYKIYKVTKKLEEDYKDKLKEGYFCRECDKYFDVLEAQFTMSNFIFRCDECNGELLENEAAQNLENNLQTKYMSSIQDIIKLLKNLDKYEIPAMDFFQLGEFKKNLQSLNFDKEQENVKMTTDDVFNIEDELIIKNESDEFVVTNKNKIEEKVKVNGRMVLFTEVTEEDKELMNEDEYEEYFEVYRKYA